MIWFLISTIFYFTIAVAVLWHVRSKTALALFGLLLCGSIWSLELFFLSSIKDPVKLAPLFQYTRAGMFFIAPLLIIFYINILKIKLNKLIMAVVAISLATSVLSSFFNIFVFPSELVFAGGRYRPAVDIFTIIYPANFFMAVGTCVALGVWAYRRAIFVERLRIKWLVIGIATGGSLGALSIYKSGLIGVTGSFICVSCFAYAAAKHRLISINSAINHGIVRLGSGALMVTVLLGINGTSWQFDLSHLERLFILAITLILAFEFYPRVSSLLRYLTERYNTTVSYNYNYTIGWVLQALKNCAAPASFSKLCDEVLHRLVRVQNYSIFLAPELMGEVGPERLKCFRPATGDTIDDDKPGADISPVLEDDAFVEMMFRQQETLFYDEAAAEHKADFSCLKASALVPIRLHNQTVGFFLLGAPLKSEQFSYDDIRLLNWFGGEIGPVLENLLALMRLETSLTEAEKTLSVVSRLNEYNHDVKTPFSNIEALLLAGDAFSPEERQARILDQVRRGHQLVATMTALLKGGHRSRRAMVDLNAAIERVVASFPAQGRMVQTEFVSLPRFEGCEEELEILLSNLLANALAARDKAEHRVRIWTWFDAETNRVGCGVQDNGRGIASDRLPGLWQAAISDRRDKGGSGLGLVVVKRIVDDHGGRIVVSSEEGVGTEFSLSLPVAADKVRSAAKIRAV